MIIVTDFVESKTKQNNFDHVIGLLDPSHKEQFPDHPSRHMFYLTDTIGGTPFCPTKEHVQEIIETFGKHNMKDSNILVHCYAGISRSTATAIGLLILSGMSVSEAHETIQHVRPCLWPNDLILKYFDEILALNGELVEYDKTWKEAQRGTLVW